MSTLTAPPPLQAEVSQITPSARAAMSTERKQHIVLGILLVVSTLLAVRLRNTAFIDEALYINAGNAYLDHWLQGRPLGDAGAFFSGAPALYPVLAALLDGLGGLYLVRTFSLACVLGTGVLLFKTASHLWDRRAGLLAAATYLLSGPVVFTSFLGTFDALVLFLITLALWLGLTRTGYPSAVVMGWVLALAALTKYTAGIYVPVVLGATLLLAARPLGRVLWGLVGLATVLTPVWFTWGRSLQDDLAFTTTDREALTPASTGFLYNLLTDHLGALMLLTVVALIVIYRSGDWRWIVVGTGFVLAAAALPLGQFILGEAVSFEKHLAYSTLMLALPLGYALGRLTLMPLMTPAVVLLVLVMALFGIVRGFFLYQWTNVIPVVMAIESNPEPGLYLSSSADVLDYHTHDLPGVAWETTFELYFEGEEGVRQAVESERYEAVIVRTSSVGNAEQDALQALLVEELEASDAYGLGFYPFSASAARGDNWLIYTHR